MGIEGRLWRMQQPHFNIQSKLVGLDGVEPSTSRLSGVRSNQAELQAPDDFWFRIADFIDKYSET